MRIAPLVSSSASPPEEWRERAASDGYLFLRRWVARDRVRALRDVALAAADELGWLEPRAPRSAGVSVPGVGLGAYDDPRWFRFLSLVMTDPAFAALQREPSLISVLETLLAGPVRSAVGDICRVVSGDDERHTTVAHQDRAYVKGEGMLWTVWLPLGDCPQALGPLAVLPGSHLGGLLPHAGDTPWRQGLAVADDALWAASDLETGDALFFTGLTVHRALPHRCGRRLRLSADYRFVAAVEPRLV
ncbi:MAG TPA: phytanoyl-CoA dioxygenase family protein [Polyangiaceae bacterium]